MNLKQCQMIAAKLGMTITRTEHDEYRVNFRNGNEDTAYYTDDLRDAIGTANAMYNSRKKGTNHAR